MQMERGENTCLHWVNGHRSISFHAFHYLARLALGSKTIFFQISRGNTTKNCANKY